MQTILECLRRSLADANDLDARGTLLLNSALSLTGINDFGREPEFIPYPLQSFAQRYLGLNYTQPHHAGHNGIAGRYDRGGHYRQPRITEIYANK